MSNKDKSTEKSEDEKEKGQDSKSGQQNWSFKVILRILIKLEIACREAGVPASEVRSLFVEAYELVWKRVSNNRIVRLIRKIIDVLRKHLGK